MRVGIDALVSLTICGVGKGGFATLLGVLMRMTKSQFAKFAAIAMFSVGAMTMSASTVGAAVDLSASDLSTISTAVSSAIASAKASLGPNATSAQIDAAIAAAISSQTQSLVTQFGQTSPMLVAEAVITAADQSGAPPSAIGTGMATAALAENSTTGLEIADAVGATAPRGAIRAFQATADASGSTMGQTLASAAGSYENVAAGGRGNGGGNGNTQSFFGGAGGRGAGAGAGAGGGGGGCRNPSCT